jgi:hypothetical protein
MISFEPSSLRRLASKLHELSQGGGVSEANLQRIPNGTVGYFDRDRTQPHHARGSVGFALVYCLSMIFSENRFPLFRIML